MYNKVRWPIDDLIVAFCACSIYRRNS